MPSTIVGKPNEKHHSLSNSMRLVSLVLLLVLLLIIFLSTFRSCVA